MGRSVRVVALSLIVLAAVACTGRPRPEAVGSNPTQEPSSLADPTATGTPSTSAVPTTGSSASTGTPKNGTTTPKKTITIKKPTTPGGVPEADLFKGEQITQGLTASSITLCEHAGTTLASAFGNDAKHFDAYWKMVNDAGGIYGRKVSLRLEDDGYNANQAATAFNNCNTANPFLTIGGIGFDQIPAVRDLAEQNKELYVYGTATDVGTSDDLYSFAAAPTVQWYGKRFAEAAVKYNPGKSVGVVTVSSAGWKPGAVEFNKRLDQLGPASKMTLEIANNNAPFTGIVKDLADAKIALVFLNVNALAFARFITEADTQGYYPRILGWSFGLATDTVGEAMKKFPLNQGLSTSPVWDPQNFYTWKTEAQKMKAAYAKYYDNDSPNDIDFIQWLGMKAFHKLLLDCTKACNRNKIVGLLLSGYKGTAAPNCEVDFGKGGGRFGGFRTNYWQAIDRGNSQQWKQIATCRSSF